MVRHIHNAALTPRTFSFTSHHRPPSFPLTTMQSSSSSSSFRHQFIPLVPDPHDAHNRARQRSAPSGTSLHASIWAPQPQSPGGIWAKDIQDYSEHAFLGDCRVGMSQHGFTPVADGRPMTREDVFGLPSGTHSPSQTAIGAIGEGRQKDLPFREAEVCQDFR